MLEKQATAIRVARETQIKTITRHHTNYPAGTITEYPPVNSYVMIEYPNTSLKKGPPNKFMTNLKGPYRVVNNIGARYTVMNLHSRKLEDFHVKSLHSFHYDETETDPAQVALKDQQHFLVDTILEHRGDIKRKSAMEFKVRWLGYTASDDSWLEWKHLRTTAPLHKYLFQNNMKSLIPKDYKLAEYN